MNEYSNVQIEKINDHEMMVHSKTDWIKMNSFFSVKEDELFEYTTRIDYMNKNDLWTSILVDWRHERICTKNFTEHPLKCAFGVKKKPNWEDFMFFLEDRCVPRTRDYMKLILRDYKLDFYDPVYITRLTGGVMAGDSHHLRIIDLEL